MLYFNTNSLESNIKPIHATPNSILNLKTSVTLFETGIKVVDLITPYKKGGKIGLLVEMDDYGLVIVKPCCRRRKITASEMHAAPRIS